MTALSYKLRRLKTAFAYPEGVPSIEVCDTLDEAASELEAVSQETAMTDHPEITKPDIPNIGRARTGPEVLRAWAKTRAGGSTFYTDLMSCADHLEAGQAELARLRDKKV